MSKKISEPTITINQAKVLYMIVNNDKTDFGEGDFGTDLESFQPVADAINDLIERGMITAGEWHSESRSSARLRDKIHKCQLTERGIKEMDKVNGDWLNSEGEFSLETWVNASEA